MKMLRLVPWIALISSNFSHALAPERHITILGTNDIHGSVESVVDRGDPVGGMAFWAGAVQAIRKGVAQKHGESGGVLVLDAGDQFQGTLLSNFNEGKLVFEAMNAVGYDAAVPGNHDYDFGPVGWLEDQVTDSSQDKNPRGALLKLVGTAKFPLLSANTYYKASLKDLQGNSAKVSDVGCRAESALDWSKAERPEFLTPYLIKQVAGVKVALIGLDNPSTSLTTTAANVSDLCFRDEVETYKEIRAALEGQADLFVIIAHNGDAKVEFHATELVKKLTEKAKLVDVLVAGHTHFVNDLEVNGVPIIQSGANGKSFGRVDLVWDASARKIRSIARTGGIMLLHEKCFKGTERFCSQVGKSVSYDGVQVEKDAHVEALIAAAKNEIAPVAGRVLGETDGVIQSHRTQESSMANAMTDTLRDRLHEHRWAQGPASAGSLHLRGFLPGASLQQPRLDHRADVGEKDHHLAREVDQDV
jgi:5'-nucleotidase